MPAEKQKIFQICPQCKGENEILESNVTGDATDTGMVTCPTCLGEGKIEWGHLLVPTP
jgi:DnaJ-class molecular chaperone